MGGVDVNDHRAAACDLNRESIISFYLLIFVDLMDVACAQF